MSRIEPQPYQPCPCGSGEKYKFCCREKHRGLNREISIRTLEFNFARAEELHRQSLAFVESGRPEEAIPLLLECIKLGPGVSQPHNNLALAYFVEGSIEKAVETAERVDREIDPGNAYSLGILVHLYLLLGREEEASKFMDRLSRIPPKDPSAAAKKCEALARFNRHSEILAVAKAAYGSCEFYAGVAAANLARYDEAKRFLKMALKDSVYAERAGEHLKLLESGKGPGTLEGDWPYLSVTDWYHPKGRAHLSKPGRIRQLPGLVHMALTHLNEDPGMGEGVVTMLETVGTPRAIEALRKIAFGRFGSDPLRTAALGTLNRMGHLGKGPHRVWNGGVWREVDVQSTELVDDSEAPLPAALEPVIREYSAATKSRDWERAERLAREAARIAPEWEKTGYLLGNALSKAGKHAEAATVLREDLKLHPGNLATAGLLMWTLLSLDQLQEAQEVLKATPVPQRIDPKTYAMYQLTCAQVGLAMGEWRSARRMVESVREMYPDFEAAKNVEGSLEFQIARFLEDEMRDRQVREARRRSRLLESDAPMATCYGELRVEDLRSMARLAGIRIHKGARKEEMVRELASTLAEPERISDILGTLAETDRTALKSVLDSGGITDLTDFSRTHARPGRDDRDDADLVEDRLAERGLLAIATVGGRVSVLIPGDLRQSIAAALSWPLGR